MSTAEIEFAQAFAEPIADLAMAIYAKTALPVIEVRVEGHQADSIRLNGMTVNTPCGPVRLIVVPK